MIFRPTTLLAVIVSLLLTACATEDIVPITEVDTSTSVFNLKETTLVIDEDTNTDLRMFDPTSGQLVYNLGSPQLDSIAPGGIILSRPTAEAPGGFLRRVTSVETTGNRMALETEPANLPDAFESYRWRLNGDNQGRGRNEPDDPFFSYGEEAVVYDTIMDLVGVDDWKFKLEFEMGYTLNFRSELDFNLSLSGSEIERMSMGMDQFSIDSIVLTASFVRGDEADEDEPENNTLDGVFPEFGELSIGEPAESFNNILTIALNPFPIDPPTSLVWVQPQVRIDISEMTESMVQIGNRFKFGHTGIFRGLIKKDNTNGGQFYTEFQRPDNLTVEAGVFFEGSYEYSSGLSIGLGISPYSRSLFTIGARATTGPYFKLEGNAALTLASVSESLELDAGASVEAGVRTSAGLFLDADFFGLAPDDWDIERTLWSSDYALINLGADAGCGSLFNRVYSNYVNLPDAADANGNGDRDELLEFIQVAVTRSDNALVNERYEVYVDEINSSRRIGGPFEADGTVHSLLRPAWLEDGDHVVRLVRSAGTSLLPCERRFPIEVVSFGTSDFCITGVDEVTDATTGASYCIREFGGVRWMANNLYTEIPEDSDNTSGETTPPVCPLGNPELCLVYGGLYNHAELTQLDQGPQPPNVRGLCPEGYHLPTRAEFRALFADATTPATTLPDGTEVYPGIGETFRARSTWGPDAPVGEGSPNRFDALAAGWQGPDDNGSSRFGEETIFWTADLAESLNTGEAAYGVLLTRGSNDLVIKSFPRGLRGSCRCVKD